jgi:hypothetical protein
MSDLLTDLMHQLQSVYTNHPGDDGRLMVAVPTTPNTMEQFEVREVHHDGPSVVLFCRPPQADEVSSQDEPPPQPQAKPKRACVHNDYEDLC